MDLMDPKSVEKTKKDLNLNTMNHNAKRHHGTDVNGEVYQVPVGRKFQHGYENIEWDK